MSFIDTIALEDAQHDVLAMYLRQQSGFGFVPNYAYVFCYRPEVMSAWANLQKTIRKTIDHRTYELVTLTAAVTMHSSYCSLAHGKVLRERFYSTEELIAIVQEDGQGVLSPLEQCIVRLSRKVVQNPSAITQDDIQALKDQGCSDAAIFDIVATASARCFFARIPEALGAQADASFGELEAPLPELLTVGRGISTRPVLRIESPEESENSTHISTLPDTVARHTDTR